MGCLPLVGIADVKISASLPLMPLIISPSLIVLAPPQLLDNYKSLFKNDYNDDDSYVEEKLNGDSILPYS